MKLRKVKEKFCPRCREDITDSYEGVDEDASIMAAGWYCDSCELFVPKEDDDV